MGKRHCDLLKKDIRKSEEKRKTKGDPNLSSLPLYFFFFIFLCLFGRPNLALVSPANGVGRGQPTRRHAPLYGLVSFPRYASAGNDKGKRMGPKVAPRIIREGKRERERERDEMQQNGRAKRRKAYEADYRGGDRALRP